MAATQAASNPMGLYDHMCRIINQYLGVECEHIVVTKKLDLNGNVISSSHVDTTIYGAISPLSQDTINESIGVLQAGDLTAYFMSEENVEVGEQIENNEITLHRIDYQGRRYSVNQKKTTAFDGGVAVIDKFVLRLIADE